MTRPIATSDDKAEPETHIRWSVASLLYAMAAWMNMIARWFIEKPGASVTYVLAGIAIIFALSLLGTQAHKAASDATIARERADRLAEVTAHLGEVTAQMKRQQSQIADLVHFEGSMTMQRHLSGERDRYFLCTTQRDALRVLVSRLQVRMPHEFRNPLAAQDAATARDLTAVLNRIGPCESILTGGAVGL